MDGLTTLLTGGTIGAALLGGAAVARHLPQFVKTRRLFRDATGDVRVSDNDLLSEIAEPRGRLRSSSIINFHQGDLRHSDGSFTRVYLARLEPTMLAFDGVVEHRYDQLARMLAVPKPPGTIISFRMAGDTDPGLAINHLVESRAPVTEVNPDARSLQNMGLAFLEGQASAGAFRRSDMIVTVRVPAKHRDEEYAGGLFSFFPTLFSELAQDGISNFFHAVTRAGETASTERIVQRIVDAENEAHKQASKVYRLVERECPLKLERLTGQNALRALYFSHNQNATFLPTIDLDETADLRGYLCNETIQSHGTYLLHGDYPVAMVSLFTPPQPFIYATSTRYLLANPQLNFRHNLVTEYISMDREAGKKKIDKRIKGIERSSRDSSGIIKLTHEARRAHDELNQVRAEQTSPNDALIRCRVYALVYGERARTRGELRAEVDRLEERCEAIISTFRMIPGAEAAREDTAALRKLYPGALLGESSQKDTGREIEEMATSMACLTPTETAFPGVRRPHSIAATTGGRLITFDFFDTSITASPVVCVLGAMGSGKTVWIANIVNDILASRPGAIAHLLDFGENFGPLAEIVGGYRVRFVPEEKRGFNIWAYEGLENGEMPDDVQVQLVVGDIMTLARVKEDDELAERVIKTCVKETYINEVPYNQEGMPYHEPTLSAFLNVLKIYKFDNEPMNSRASLLWNALQDFKGHPWLDAPTDEVFKRKSNLYVYEMDSLNSFEKDVRAAMAYRVAARMTRAIGEMRADGTRAETVIVFDEFWRYEKEFPQLIYPIQRGTRQGRRDRVVTILATHDYKDLKAVEGIAKNAGIKIIGLQIGNFDTLADDTNLSPAARSAVQAIHNQEGVAAQFVISIGTGNKQVVEMIEVSLSPVALWTFTSNAVERNARNFLRNHRPELSELQRVAMLAEAFPRGMAHAGVAELDPAMFGIADFTIPPTEVAEVEGALRV